MINWSRVEELREEIGPEDFGDVVELFLEEVDEEIAGLSEPDADAKLEARLHFLKGSALNLGFEAFSDLCRDGEQSAARGEGATVNLPHIQTCYSQSKDLFLSELGTRFE